MLLGDPSDDESSHLEDPSLDFLRHPAPFHIDIPNDHASARQRRRGAGQALMAESPFRAGSPGSEADDESSLDEGDQSILWAPREPGNTPWAKSPVKKSIPEEESVGKPSKSRSLYPSLHTPPGASLSSSNTLHKLTFVMFT